ncbi:hypothetical protein D3C80_1141160 [compost metagenome]
MDDNEEYRDQEYRQQGGADHAEHDAGADCVLRAGTGTAAENQRQHAKDKGQRGHQDRPQTHAGGFKGGGNQRFALFLHQILGEFDDKNGVFG